MNPVSCVSRKWIVLAITAVIVPLAGCRGPMKTAPWRSDSTDFDLSLPPISTPQPLASTTASGPNVQTSFKSPDRDSSDDSVQEGGSSTPLLVRNQNPVDHWQNETASDGSDRTRYPMQPSGAAQPPQNSSVQPAQYADPVAQSASDLWGIAPNANGYPVQTTPQPVYPQQTFQQAPPGSVPGPAPNGYYPPPYATGPPPSRGPQIQTMVAPNGQVFPQYSSPDGPFDPTTGPLPEGGMLGVPSPLTDIFVNVRETQTGRFMLGASVNSNAGVTGQIVVDEKNFDWRRIPTDFDDFINGSAFRGAGQGFRIEALPGRIVQRYMLQYTNPYVFGSRTSMNFSGYVFNRRFFDWDEQRLGGRLGFGRRITPDLSISLGIRAEEVTISDPRLPGVPELDAAIGEHDLYSGRLTLVQDTRDISFQPTQGYYLELSFEQVFGSFDYSRAEIDYRRYFLLAERPDGSGRHVVGFSNRVGFTGAETPVFENFFAGGYSTLRGFDFRRASPQSGGVTVGGEFQLLGSVEYLFPITADDMLKGVAFVDYGTIEEDIEINAEDYRVSIGMGLRIFVPAMGPAPIALDFAVPIAREDTDEIRQFSFFIGVSR